MCLLNGEVSGSVESPVDFGTIEEEDQNGVWTIRKLPIKEIIRNDISDDDWLLLKAKLSRRNQLLKDGEITAYLDADIKFHVFIVKLSQNKYLEQWYTELLPVWQMFLSQLVFREDGYTGNTQLHNELYEALISRNERRAVQLINKIGGENVGE